MQTKRSFQLHTSSSAGGAKSLEGSRSPTLGSIGCIALWALFCTSVSWCFTGWKLLQWQESGSQESAREVMPADLRGVVSEGQQQGWSFPVPLVGQKDTKAADFSFS